jgi:hypothetical protein
MKAALFVPAHVPPTADIRKLTQLNKKSVFSVADTIADWCVPLTTNEVLLKKVFKQYKFQILKNTFCNLELRLRELVLQ